MAGIPLLSQSENISLEVELDHIDREIKDLVQDQEVLLLRLHAQEVYDYWVARGLPIALNGSITFTEVELAEQSCKSPRYSDEYNLIAEASRIISTFESLGFS